MEFIDLKAQQARIRKKIDENIARVLGHGKYILGPEVKELEEKLAAYAGVKFGVGVGNGTDALLLPLMAWDVGPGDAVFTSTFTFIATAEVVQLLRATPVFVDVDPKTYNLDPRDLEKKVQAVSKEGRLRPKGVIPVDIFGQLADYAAIDGIAQKYNLFVLEDAAQSYGASSQGKKAGAFGQAAAASFFPAKPLGGYGDGGMIFTNDQGLRDTLLSIRVHGQGSDKYDNVRVGINGRLDTLQAAILLAKFEIFDEEIALRQTVARRYSEGLKNAFTVPHVAPGHVSAWAQYSLLHPERDKKLAQLKAAGIPSAVYYPKPLHLQTAFKHLGGKPGDFPVAEKIAAQVFSVPMHPYLGEGGQAQIINALQ